MRLRIDLACTGVLDWRALGEHSSFLFRRIGGGGRAVLGVGEREAATFALHASRIKHRGTDTGAVEPRGHFALLKSFLVGHKDWAFGHLAYDLKNEVEDLNSRHEDLMGFPQAHWWVPRFAIELDGPEAVLHVHEEDRTEGEEYTRRLLDGSRPPVRQRAIEWRSATPRRTYLERAAEILRHVQRGDMYELNYCVERRAVVPGWDPYAAFAHLIDRLDPPHAAFYRIGDRFALCASPERFLRIEGRRVIAQPMKGTRPRGVDEASDRALAAELASDAKERSENIMAVDVMRNDLSRVAARSSVRVDELCAVKRFPAVHQMVSTVGAELAPGLHAVDAIRAAWPMASMTGAPKVSAMRLIDEVEDQRRGLFSGSLGYFSPEGVMDLNVVIRAVLFNASTGRLSLSTGGALTAACDPEKEWEECELKARSVIDALGTVG